MCWHLAFHQTRSACETEPPVLAAQSCHYTKHTRAPLGAAGASIRCCRVCNDQSQTFSQFLCYWHHFLHICGKTKVSSHLHNDSVICFSNSESFRECTAINIIWCWRDCRSYCSWWHQWLQRHECHNLCEHAVSGHTHGESLNSTLGSPYIISCCMCWYHYPVVSSPTLCLESGTFSTHLRDRLSWLKFFWVFLSSSRWCKLHYSHFLLHPFHVYSLTVLAFNGI